MNKGKKSANASKKPSGASGAVEKRVFGRFPPLLVMIAGAILTLFGIITLSLTDAARLNDMRTAKTFIDICYVRAEPNSNFNGYPVIVSGEPEWNENTASDLLFGVTADTACLFRVSEMAQWSETESGYELVWSEELISSEDFPEEYKNPTAYPLNTKSNSYTAVGVNINGFALEDEIIVLMPGRARLAALPETEVAGYRTDGEYITNSESLASPSVGDVRIHYEYLTGDTVSIAARQRESGLTRYIIDSDNSVYLVLPGEHGRADVLTELRSQAAAPDHLMRAGGIALCVFGMLILFIALAKATGYAPKIIIGKGKKPIFSTAATVYVFGAAAGVLTAAITLGARWGEIYSAGIWAALALTAVYLYAFILSLIKYMPKRVRVEEEYVPIIQRRQDKDKR